MSVMHCAEATFVNTNSYLVARIGSFDTTGLHILTSRILEPYPSSYTAFGLSHGISH